MFEATPETGGKVVVSKREHEDSHNDSMDKSEIVNSIKIINESDEYYEEEDVENDHEQQFVDEAGNGVIYESHEQFTEVVPSNEQHESEVQHLDEEDIIALTPRINKKRKFDNWNDFDDDENGDKFFAMSIACTIKRLSPINNIKAKTEIFQILEKYADKK
jgi:BESS motif